MGLDVLAPDEDDQDLSATGSSSSYTSSSVSTPEQEDFLLPLDNKLSIGGDEDEDEKG